MFYKEMRQRMAGLVRLLDWSKRGNNEKDAKFEARTATGGVEE